MKGCENTKQEKEIEVDFGRGKTRIKKMKEIEEKKEKMLQIENRS